MHDEISKAMADAVAAYAGAVRRCPPGKARGRRVKPKNAAMNWLIGHRDDPPVVDAKEQLRRSRTHYSQKQRITERNSPILKRINKQARRAAFNQAVMHRLNEER